MASYICSLLHYVNNFKSAYYQISKIYLIVVYTNKPEKQNQNGKFIWKDTLELNVNDVA